jgi:hypothetical protein
MGTVWKRSGIAAKLNNTISNETENKAHTIWTLQTNFLTNFHRTQRRHWLSTLKSCDFNSKSVFLIACTANNKEGLLFYAVLSACFTLWTF